MGKGKSLDEKFEAIGEKCAQEAGDVKCSIREYMEGLKQIIGHLQVCVEAAECDLKGKGGDGE